MRESGLREAARKRKGSREEGVGTQASSISVSNNSVQNSSVTLWRRNQRAAEGTKAELRLSRLCLSLGVSLRKVQHFINRYDPAYNSITQEGKVRETRNRSVILGYIASSGPAWTTRVSPKKLRGGWKDGSANKSPSCSYLGS